MNRPLDQPSSTSRGGGWRQQAARHLDRERSRVRQPTFGGNRRCKSAEEHLRDWAEGISSAPRVARHCVRMREDDFSAPMVLRLAKVAGLQEGIINDRTCHSGIMALVKECGVHDLVHNIINHDSVIACIKPTALLKLIFERSPSAFRKGLGADSDLCYKFWCGIYASAKGREFFELHPGLRGKTPADLKYTVPMGLHEDAGPYAKRRSANCVSYSGILGVGRDVETKLLYATEVKFSKADGFVQDQKSWEIVVREFDMLALGVMLMATSCFRTGTALFGVS